MQKKGVSSTLPRMTCGNTPQKKGSEKKKIGCPCTRYPSRPTRTWTHLVPYHYLSSNTHILTLSQRKADLPAVDINSIQPSCSPPPAHEVGPRGDRAQTLLSEAKSHVLACNNWTFQVYKRGVVFPTSNTLFI